MSEASAPSASALSGHAAVERARTAENVVVGDEIVRHRLLSRVIHWSVALFFLGCLASGMPIWSPVFGWMAALFGGLSVCRWLHPWLGLAFAAASLAMFVHWFSEMKLEKNERSWLSPTKLIEYLRFGGDDPEVGKYNGGQKLFFFTMSLGTLLLLASGVVLWFPVAFGQGWREISILLHDASYIAFFVAIVFHIYLGTAGEPGTFRSMTRGTVSKAWARLHHPRWYRDVTGERGDKS